MHERSHFAARPRGEGGGSRGAFKHRRGTHRRRADGHTSQELPKVLHEDRLPAEDEIEDELRWEPKINAAQIGVIVDKGAVTLNGAVDVDTYAANWATEDATKRVFDVRSVAQGLTVKLPGAHQRNDTDIAEAIVTALTWDVFVPDGVTARVQKGEVTLEGTVRWTFEREAAERAARYLTGVTKVYNSIALKPEASATALQRQANTDTDTHSITIETNGGKVTLGGHASSWTSIEDASNAAWAAPGVTDVIDQNRYQP